MTRKEALADLLAKVQADTIRGNFAKYCDPLRIEVVDAMRAHRGSLDAAKALHEAVLPEYDAQIRLSGEAVVWRPEWAHDWPGLLPSGDCPGNPARALLIADIKALIAQEEQA